MDGQRVRRRPQRGAQRVRRADLLVTLADGSRVAVEVQYSGLTIQGWWARHRDYRARGITDVWL